MTIAHCTSGAIAAAGQVTDANVGSINFQSLQRTKVAKIDDAAAALQQQQLVEGLEDVDGRLVNGANHRPPSVDGVANGPHDDGGRARVQTCVYKWLLMSVPATRRRSARSISTSRGLEQRTHTSNPQAPHKYMQPPC